MKKLIVLLIILTISNKSVKTLPISLNNNCKINICQDDTVIVDNVKQVLINKIMSTLKTLESQNDTSAIGDNGKAYGILQIHKICVDDVNRIYKTNYTHNQMFNEKISEQIFELYIKHGIELFEKKYGELPTEQHIVRMWNGNIYNGYNKISTLKYYKKYLKIKKI